MTKLDSQLDWLVQQIKAFVLSHYAGQITLHCKQGLLLEIETSPSSLLADGYAAEVQLRKFQDSAQPGDTIKFICRKDDKIGQMSSIVLKVPNG